MNEELQKIKETLDQKIREKKQEQANKENLGWFSVLVDSAVDRFGKIVSKWYDLG